MFNLTKWTTVIHHVGFSTLYRISIGSLSYSILIFHIAVYDAICSNQLALYMRFYIPRRPAHMACVHTSPLPSSYGINLTGLRQHGRFDQVLRSTMSTIEDPTTFSISMCFSSSTMYFQVHGTGILVAVL